MLALDLEPGLCVSAPSDVKIVQDRLAQPPLAISEADLSRARLCLALAEARRIPSALQFRNLSSNELTRTKWELLLTLLIRALLPDFIQEDDEKLGRLTFDRFVRTRRGDRCILGLHKGHGTRLHHPIHIAPEGDDEWATCSLTQQPDARWMARFTHIPQHVRQKYESSESLRRRHRTLGSYARPRTGRRIGVHALICWWAYGAPSSPQDTATHFVCDQSRCLNPRHLGWASNKSNYSHYEHHQQTMHRSPQEIGPWRVPRHSDPPARRLEL